MADSCPVALRQTDFAIACDAASRDTARLLRAELEAATGWHINLTEARSCPEPGRQSPDRCNTVTLTADAADLPADGYRLRSRDGAVTISGGGPAGVFYGTRTLRLLLPPDTLREAAPDPAPPAIELPATEITDQPRYAWRGVHLDVARHFMPKQWILRLVDLAALHKLNVLHLHLTDDQGWRFQVERYPLLTETGAWRRRSPVGHARDNRFDRVPHGGYYTHADLREIVSYARRRHVTVVPEIDMPGHMQAAIAAYPELGNTDAGKGRDKPLRVWSRWGISRHVLNLEDETVEFCRNILDEVMDVFPGPYVHLGGDECPTAEWHLSPRAQKHLRALGLRHERQMQGWFTNRASERIVATGRRIVAWDEAVDAGAAADTIIMAWRADGHMGRWAAELGHQVVMAPEYWTYLDWAQSDDEGEPLAIRGTTTVRDVYEFDPVPRGLSERAKDNIIGAQAQLWTEYVPDAHHAEYMYFPRLCAFSEVVWSPPGGEYAGFEGRLGRHLSALDARGVNYRPRR